MVVVYLSFMDGDVNFLLVAGKWKWEWMKQMNDFYDEEGIDETFSSYISYFYLSFTPTKSWLLQINTLVYLIFIPIHLIDCSFVSANLLASDRIFFADLNERIFQNPPHHQNKHKNQEGKLERKQIRCFWYSRIRRKTLGVWTKT